MRARLEGVQVVVRNVWDSRTRPRAPSSHYAEVFSLLDGGLRDGGWMGEGLPQGGHALAILPGLTHYNIFSSPLFAAVTPPA
jgi:hypothetical protein